MGKRSRRRRDDEPGDRPEAVDALLGPDRPADADPDTAPVEDPVAATPEGDAAPEEAGQPARKQLADVRLREVIALAEEADMLYHLYRWVVLKGGVPTARDWLPREDLPHPDGVSDVFGSWQKFLEHSQLADSPLLARLRTVDAREQEL